MSYEYESTSNKFQFIASKDYLDEIISVWETGETLWHNSADLIMTLEDVYKYIGGMWCIRNSDISDRYKQIFLNYGWEDFRDEGMDSVQLMVRQNGNVAIGSSIGEVNWLVRQMLNNNKDIDGSFKIPFEIAYLPAPIPDSDKIEGNHYGINDQVQCYPRGSCGECVICTRTLKEFKL